MSAEYPVKIVQDLASKLYNDFEQLWDFAPQTKLQCLVNSAARLLLLPLVLLHEAAILPSRIIYDEMAHQHLGGAKGGRAKIIVKRFVECACESLMLTWQSILYVVGLEIAGLLGLQHVAHFFKHDAEAGLAALTGVQYTLANGGKVPNAAINVADPDYTPCKLLDDCNPSMKDTECRSTAYMAALCTKLVYEDRSIVADVVRHRWGGTLMAHEALPADAQEEYRPSMVWLACEVQGYMFLAFKGAEPFLQIDRRADVPIARVAVPGMGEVNEGFLRGLLQLHGTADQSTVFDSIVRTLRTRPADPIVVTGHSIGGALAAICAQLLHLGAKDVAGRVAGVWSLAAPRVGDAEFCRLLEKYFCGCVWRYVHAGDMVPKLPQGFGYDHHGVERFVTSWGVCRILREEVEGKEALRRARVLEDRCAYPFSLAKLLASPWQESLVRTWARAALLALPGLSDHFVSDYIAALQADLSTD